MGDEGSNYLTRERSTDMVKHNDILANDSIISTIHCYWFETAKHMLCHPFKDAFLMPTETSMNSTLNYSTVSTKQLENVVRKPDCHCWANYHFWSRDMMRSSACLMDSNHSQPWMDEALCTHKDGNRNQELREVDLHRCQRLMRISNLQQQWHAQFSLLKLHHQLGK